jgi:hypothetical protein
VNTFFGVTGDPLKVTIDTINYVAASGIKVALVYGDRDYRCNCTYQSPTGDAPTIREYTANSD